MKLTMAKLLVYLVVTLVSLQTSAAKQQDPLQLSGFARVVLGYLDESNASYLGYENALSLEQQSLIGLQADYQIKDNLSITAQFIGHTSNERESGIEWLYLTYKPHRAVQIKLGKQRTPFFNYSDSIDVGFAYPWITLPQQVYNSVFFSTFEGLLANYEWSSNNLIFNLEGYWGSYDDTIINAGIEVDGNINDLRGLVGKMTYDSWTLRAAMHTTDTFIGLTEVRQLSGVLQQFGFNKSAEFLNPDGTVDFYQVAASYEDLNYFFRTEIAKIDAQSSTVPDIDSFFVAAGYNYYPFLSYVSFGKNSSTYPQPINEIPIGIDPQLDALAFGFQSVIDGLPLLSSKSLTFGTRWDYKSNLAFKAEVTWIEAKSDNQEIFVVSDPTKFDSKAPLYQLAVEWVF